MKNHTDRQGEKEVRAKLGRDWRTGEFVPESEYLKNPDRYELIEVRAYDDPRLTMLRAMVYEPEHTKGGMCWCGVDYRAERKEGKRHIEITHHSQRDALVDYVRKNFV